MSSYIDLKKVFIIAEAGVNHNGLVDRAYELVDVARSAGADAVKFQLFKSEELVTKVAPQASYQTKNAGVSSQFEMLKKLELSFEEQKKISEYCKKSGLIFMTSAFDLESLALLPELGVTFVKVPSGEITNLPYLRDVARQQPERIILSTGASELLEVEQALNVFEGEGVSRDRITVLHCNTEYPSPYEDVNMRAMQTIRDSLKVQVGYSDHTEGCDVSMVAVALGAVCVEKHFTTDKNLPGPDHKASLEPDELKIYVQSIRDVEKILGSDVKTPSPSESKNRSVIRKSIVAKKEIKRGEILSNQNMTCKRPGSGISPMQWDQLVGKAASRAYLAEDFIQEEL